MAKRDAPFPRNACIRLTKIELSEGLSALSAIRPSHHGAKVARHQRSDAVRDGPESAARSGGNGAGLARLGVILRDPRPFSPARPRLRASARLGDGAEPNRLFP